jgi:DNA-binding LacI/PurR family transcriptional regulator
MRDKTIRSRPNQTDIARQLGVSVSTVSRALANESGISETLRSEVVKAARALGYKSKHAGLAPLERRAVALVPLGSAASAMSGFYVGIVEGMRATAAEIGLALEVRLVNESMVTLAAVERHLEQSDARALLLAGIDPWDELVAWCATNAFPAVLVNGSDPLMRMSSVSPSNFYGARLATERLLEAGHRRILHYTHMHRPTILERRRGFEAAIAGVPGAEGVVISTGERKTAELLDDILADRHGVTALFSWNDIAAVEMLEGLHGGGKQLPPRFSIIGFDDLPIASMSTPRLSTMRVNREGIGDAAVRLMMRLMEGDTAIHQIEIGVSVVPGETVWAIR